MAAGSPDSERDVPIELYGDVQLCKVLLSIDAILLKAAGASSEVVFRNSEERLYLAMVRAWQSAAVDAINAVTNLSGDRPATQSDVERINTRLSSAMHGWEQPVQPMLDAVMSDAYTAGKYQIWGRAQGRINRKLVAKAKTVPLHAKPSITLQDKHAIDVLSRRQMWWMGRHYGVSFQDRLAQVVSQTMLETGLGRAEAGLRLRYELRKLFDIDGTEPGDKAWGVPGQFNGSPEQYFRGLAANTVTVARVQGTMKGLMEIRATKYEVVNPEDERTCGRCNFMSGKTFSVKESAEVAAYELAANDPYDVKYIHPWPKDVDELKAAEKSGDLGQKFPLPPYHFECRCTIDITGDTEFGEIPPEAAEYGIPESEGVAGLRPSTIWDTPPGTITELDRRLKLISKDAYDDAYGFTSTDVEQVSKLKSGAAAIRAWEGEIKMLPRYYDQLTKVASTGVSRGEWGANLFVHEHLHGLGKHKVPSTKLGNPFRKNYAKAFGRTIQEGSVELLAVIDHPEILRRAGIDVVKPTSQRWVNGKLFNKVHAYTREVDFVEHIVGVASGEVAPGVQAELGARGRKVLEDLVFRWSPQLRTTELAELIATRAADVDQKLKGVRVTALQLYIERSAASKWGIKRIGKDLNALISAKTTGDVERAFKRITGKNVWDT